MSDEIIIHLPWPPSVNHYYIHVRRRIVISRVGRKYREQTIKEVCEQVPDVGISHNMHVEVQLYPPDRRGRDVDNYMKSLLDAVTHSGLWEDDKLIDQLFIYRGERIQGGGVILKINEAGPVLPYNIF